MRAFLTGGSGFLGGHVARALVESGWSITALKRPSSDISAVADLPIDWVDGDLTDVASLKRALPPETDAVFHCAADTSMWRKLDDRQTQVNVGGTRAMLEATAGVRRFIHTSSISSWGLQDAVLTEETPQLGGWSNINYFRTKYQAEELVRNSGRDVVILNPCHIMGPGDTHNWSQLFFLVRDKELPSVPAGGGPMVDVREVAKAHVSAFEKGVSGENYILASEAHNFGQVVTEIGKLLNCPPPTRSLPVPLVKLFARLVGVGAAITGKEPSITPEKIEMTSHLVRASSDRAASTLGYNPNIPMASVLKDTYDWLVKTGRLES